jgi:hypothetical protein
VQTIGWAIEKDFDAMFRLWADDMFHFRLFSPSLVVGLESCLENVFQTGVLEKGGGRWVHVLILGSYPVDKIPESYVREFYSNLFEEKE